MRVLLVSANQEDINMVTLPLGLAFVAAAAERAGHEVELVDLMGEDRAEERLAEAVGRFDPEVIGVSVRNIDDQNMEAPRFLLERVKVVTDACRTMTSAPLVAGGAGYSIFPKSALDYLGADYGIRGEGERAFVDLLARLESGEDTGDLPGLFRPGRGPATARKPMRNMDELPWSEAAWWLTRTGKNPAAMLPVQTRRGCPLRCSYCSTPAIEGTTIRRCSPEKAAQAVAAYLAAGVGRLFFTDNTFNLPPSHAKELCRAMIRRGLKPSWNCIVHPGRLDAELAGLMAEAGCTQVSLGFESGSARMLRRLGKRFSPEDIQRDRDLLAEVGIGVMGFLMLGCPGETRETVGESLDFIDRLNPDMLRVTIGVRIYPETPLAAEAAARGIIRPDDDLLQPRFYLEPGLETWLREATAAWAAGRKNCLLG